MEIKLKVVSVAQFADLLKRFSSIDPNILFSISSDKIHVRMSDVNKKVIKFYELPFSDVFLPISDNFTLNKEILVGLLNTDRIIKSLALFEGDDVEFSMTYDLVKKSDRMAGKNITFKSNRLKFTWPCCRIDLFPAVLDMTDRIFEDIISPIDFDFKIALSKRQTDEIKRLSVLDSGSEELHIQAKDRSCQFFGNTFNIKYDDDIQIEEESDVAVPKKYLQHLDDETYSVSIHSEKSKVLFLNNSGNSGICLGISITSDEEETADDFK